MDLGHHVRRWSRSGRHRRPKAQCVQSCLDTEAEASYVWCSKVYNRWPKPRAETPYDRGKEEDLRMGPRQFDGERKTWPNPLPQG